MAGSNEGNTKPRSKSKFWCFTSFAEGGPCEPDQTWTEKVQYCIYQAEICPKTKKRHYQGYIELLYHANFNVVKDIIDDNKAHVECKRGTREQARDYCRKTETREPGTEPIEWGKWDPNGGQGSRTDLRETYELIKQGERLGGIAERNPGVAIRYGRGIERLIEIQQFKKERSWKTICEVYWSTESCTGKSHKARVENPGAYYKPDEKNWDGYDGHETVIIDDFEIAMWNRKELLNMLDKYPWVAHRRYASTPFLAKKIIITTNEDPKTWFQMYPQLERRIEKIVHMNQVYKPE